MNELENKITNITAPEIVCGGCAVSIKKSLGNLAGVSDVNVDVASKKVTVEHAQNVSRDDIINALDQAGFSAE